MEKSTGFLPNYATPPWFAQWLVFSGAIIVMVLVVLVASHYLERWENLSSSLTTSVAKLPESMSGVTPHTCEGCVRALRAVEDLTAKLRSRYDLVPSEQALTPVEFEQARSYLSTTAVRDLPTGWVSAIVVKKRSEGGGTTLAVLAADDSVYALDAGASSEGPVRGDQVRLELDSHQMAALVDLGDHLVLNPTAFGRRPESPQWVLKTGEWRLVKKFAIPTR